MTLNCQECGACCGYAADGAVAPTGQTEDARCGSLRGEIGVHCECAIYDQRPAGCRDFEAGSGPCLDTRWLAWID